MRRELWRQSWHVPRAVSARWDEWQPAHFSHPTGHLLTLVALLTSRASLLTAQDPPVLEQERREFTHWLQTSPLSPYAILVLQPVGSGISVGAEPSDVPLPIGTRWTAKEAGGVVTLEQGDRRITLPRGRAVTLEGFQLVASGPVGRAAVAAFGAVRGFQAPTFYPYASELVFRVTLRPPERRGQFRTLAPDGSETEAIEVGLTDVTVSGTRTGLRVYRIGAATDEEAELLIFFRDATNGHGSYPAGRFVPLRPAGGGQYLLDFNRARNPFCAYRSVLPCPAPWPGNSIAAAVPAGERYVSHDPRNNQ